MHGGTNPTANSAFLAGGEMGALMRAHNWSATPLGPPEMWPQPLRTALRLLLNTGHPMYVWWGPDLLCFYNDAYRASIGPERHPGSLGRPGREVWDEIWPIIGPQIEQVMASGGATWHENQLVPITRNGRLEDVYWTYSYGPVDDETAPTGVGGVLVVCTETTQQVLAEQRARAERERLGQMFEQAPGFMAMLEGPEHRFTQVNAAYRRLIGSRDVTGQTIRAALPDIEGQGFYELLDQVYATGEPFRGAATAVRLARGAYQAIEERVVDFVYQPVTNAEGQVVAFFVEGSDIAEAHRAQVALRESEARLRALTDNLPGGMVYQIATGRDGRERHFVYVSQSHEKLTGVSADAVMADPSVPYNLILPAYRERMAQAEATALRDRQPFDIQVQFRRTDGQVRWARIISAPREQADGALIWDGIQIDITAQKEAEAKLRELNDTLEARVTEAVAERQILADVVESTNASVLVSDMEYRILAINRANVAETERVWGKRPRVGDSILALVADMPEIQAQVARNWARALAGEEFMIVEEFGDTAQNRVAYEVRFNVLRDREGRQIGAFSTSYDVTDRVRARPSSARPRMRCARPRRWKSWANSPVAWPTTLTIS